MLYFNKDGYSVYCKKYKEYWEWVGKRNEARYNTTMSHGKNYDSKNMMHVFRLLLMAKEIAEEGKINVYRNDREFLLSIKEGKDIPIEERAADELRQVHGVPVAPSDVPVFNPGFDMTPNKLISGIITEMPTPSPTQKRVSPVHQPLAGSRPTRLSENR